MANIRTQPPKVKLKLKHGRFPDNGTKGIGQVEIELMPNCSHLSCPHCGNFKLGVSLSSFDNSLTRTGCPGCGWESWIDAQLMPEDFTGSCPKCSGHEFIIMKLDNKIGVGCAKCSWETVNKINDNRIIIPGR